jgi:hypothetical protein
MTALWGLQSNGLRVDDMLSNDDITLHGGHVLNVAEAARSDGKSTRVSGIKQPNDREKTRQAAPAAKFAGKMTRI